MNATIDSKAAAGEKFYDSEVTSELVRQANVWLDDYDGNFSYIHSMLDARIQRGALSTGQIRGVLNCMVADAKRAAAAAATAATTTAAPATQLATGVRDGIYTIVIDGGSNNRTVRIRKGKGDASDVRFVSYLRGPNNENDYKCCGLIRNGEFHWTRAFDQQAPDSPLNVAVQTLLSSPSEEQHRFGQAYALESGNCYVCNRTLTDQTSIELGIGPICRDK